MRVFDRLPRLVRACLQTRRRAQLSALLLLVVGGLAWYTGRVVWAHVAVADAKKAIARYDFQAARDRLRLATRLRPRKPEIWLLAAQAARRGGDLIEAKTHLARYEALTGARTPEGHLEELLQRAQSGEIGRDAYDLTLMADAGDPATEQILEALALGDVHLYQFDRAGLLIHHLLTRFPKNPIGRLIRAQMDDVLGRRERAAAECRELLADFPDNWQAKLLLAGLLYRSQQFAEAADMYEDLRRRRPGELSPLLGLARCWDRMGRRDEARLLMRELEEKFSDNSEAMLECGRFALTDNRPDDAERFFRRANQLAPNDHEIHYQLGLCLERAGKTEEAQRHFERFKQIEADLVRLDALLKAVVNTPRDPAPRREAGVICLRNGQTAEGLRWLQGALEVAPADKATHAVLADYFRGQGDEARANSHRR